MGRSLREEGSGTAYSTLGIAGAAEGATVATARGAPEGDAFAITSAQTSIAGRPSIVPGVAEIECRHPGA